jgi:hypothetical protein
MVKLAKRMQCFPSKYKGLFVLVAILVGLCGWLVTKGCKGILRFRPTRELHFTDPVS